MSPEHDQKRHAQRGLDAAIDQLLDGSVQGEARKALLSAVRRDEAGRQELLARASAVMLLRESVEAPDLSGAILHDVDRRRPFLSGRLRRLVSGSRLVLAGTGVAAVLAVALVVRANPGAFRVSQTEAPVTRISEAVRTESAMSRRAATERADQANRTLWGLPAGPDYSDDLARSGDDGVRSAAPSGSPAFTITTVSAPSSSPSRPMVCPVFASSEPEAPPHDTVDAPLP